MNQKISRMQALLQAWTSCMRYQDRFYPGSLARIVSLLSIYRKFPKLAEQLRQSDESFVPVGSVDPDGELSGFLDELLLSLQKFDAKTGQDDLLLASLTLF